MNTTLPQLPPGWKWHKNNGQPNVFIQWRAVGPVVSGRSALEAYGRFKHNQTPEAAARDAWKIWERLSGVSKEEWEYLQDCKNRIDKMSDDLSILIMGPIPDYGDHMTIEAFNEMCRSGAIIDDDGMGSYASETEMSNIDAIPSNIFSGIVDKRFTHVIWFDK